MAFRALSALVSAALLFVVAGSSIAGASVQGHSAAVKAHTAASTTVSVTAIDFKFKLSASSVAKPGSVTFKIKNSGHVQHDFKIDGKTSVKLAPGKSTTLTVKFAKKGSYFYECTVPGHAALGMKGNFKVK
jgi:uncharacterized cupredoxin-like copper-binding protein